LPVTWTYYEDFKGADFPQDFTYSSNTCVQGGSTPAGASCLSNPPFSLTSAAGLGFLNMTAPAYSAHQTVSSSANGKRWLQLARQLSPGARVAPAAAQSGASTTIVLTRSLPTIPRSFAVL
jgi:hypothetical protein